MTDDCLLTLASTSPYRARLLRRLRLPFNTEAPNVDETPIMGESGMARARRLATAKASATQQTAGLIIGSDQVAVCEQVILHKPGTPERASEQLARCSGKTVAFHTGVSVWQPQTDRSLVHVESYAVKFRDLTAQEISDYVSLDEPLDCAGSFKWESLGITLFEKMTGDDPTALEGLPLIALCRMLRAFNQPLPPRA